MSPLRFAVIATSSSLLVVACATRSPPPGVDPHEMSAASHELTAAVEERAALEHEVRYDPSARQRHESCRFGRAAVDADPCWTSVTNPTSEQLRFAEAHRAHAADHRAASQALRDAEARACAGVPAADRDESPFDHRDDIASVEDLYSSAGRLEGGAVRFRAVPGMSAKWLQRVVDCHLARNAALGNDVPEMDYCPLVPKNVRATVRPASDGYAVDLRSDDDATAREIARRVHALLRR